MQDGEEKNPCKETNECVYGLGTGNSIVITFRKSLFSPNFSLTTIRYIDVRSLKLELTRVVKKGMF